MSDSGFKLPKFVAKEMVDDLFKTDLASMKTVYNTYMKDSKSMSMKNADALREFTDDISPALKRMKISYLEDVVSSCYPAKHISDSFTNEE